MEQLREIPVDQIKSKAYEFRDKEVVESDDFQELFLSIKIHGILQPLTVRDREDDTEQYQIVDGDRRYRAARLLGLKNIPAIVKKATLQDSSKQDLVWSYVQNVQNKQLSDIEKAKAMRSIYEHSGYNLDTALQHLNNLRNNKYGNQTLKVPKDFVDLANSIGRANSTQWFLLKLLKDVPSAVLTYAEEAGLDISKKQMLTYPVIKKSPELQKAVINMIKDMPKEGARQLVHNIETGAYKFTGKGFRVEGASEKLQRQPIEFSKDAFLSFNEASSLSRKLLHQLTGIDSDDYTEEDIRNTRNYRLEKVKQLSARELNIFWNVLKPLKSAIEDELSLLEQEIETRKKNGKLMER